MLLEAVYHRLKSNYAYAFDKETLHIRLRTKLNDVKTVTLHYLDKFDQKGTAAHVEMRRFASDAMFDYYEAMIRPPFRRCAYFFHLISGTEEVWYLERGFQNTPPLSARGTFEFPFINPVDIISAPSWVKEAVFYQIFPERFANGDTVNDPRNVEPWGGKPKPGNFFGGDLQGVIDHIDHLKELGINAIYFTPLFEAKTNHKYDTVDYLKIDPHFGDNQLLKTLVELCHENGIRVVLDAVFNHCGYHFPPFQDVLKHQQASKYINWFHLREFPVKTNPKPNFDTFAFTPMMPKLNTENPEVIEYLLKVARYWIEEIGVDGWRLDVANEVDHYFWREFRKVVKQAKPDAYILGEVWHNSAPWLQGDQFDAVMNYPFTNAVLDFFCKDEMDAERFITEINALHIEYPLQLNHVAFNLLDSHDTPRILTICQNDKRRLKLALTFQFTYLGTPCIYYGGEIGLTGENDPDCRKTMIWDELEQDLELFDFYKKMIHLRKEYSALRDGQFSFITGQKDHKQIAYERRDDNDHFVIIINASETSTSFTLTLPAGKWLDVEQDKWIEIQDHQVQTFEMGSLSTIILKKERDLQ